MKRCAKKFSAVLLTVVLFTACGKAAEAVDISNIPDTVSGSVNADMNGFWQEQFAANGAAPDFWEYSSDENIFTVTVTSNSDSDTVSFSDIKQLRAVRNALRYSGELPPDMTYREILKTDSGKFLLDSETYPLKQPTINGYSELRKNIGVKNTDSALIESISSKDVSASIEYSPAVGNTLKIEIDGGSKTRPEIEEKIKNIVLKIENYNTENFSVQQLEIVSDPNGDAIYFLADLVYRDFLCSFDPYFV